ncbi:MULTISPECIES: GyrI-like domain-containing protein [Actinomadura]|uniref:GyrI-like domain-containing protein n=1 Tax=Actinomadura yumaensis TaxID=111807 RepID=A0ABW2CF42_9ACTN|nr:effector binding domain-containing protein [Actinomadura sp. J1-007]MWK34649.1 AraC family transcriptional regulator [Actinomadura sp. J1-007]
MGEIAARDPRQIVGYVARTTNAAEADPERALLPDLWRRAAAPGAFDQVRARADDRLYAVLTDYESDHTGAYTQVVGVAVTSVDGMPEGLVAVRVPADANCYRIEARGPMPQALIGAWRSVWDDPGIDRAYTTDLEIHHDEGADIFLALR